MLQAKSAKCIQPQVGYHNSFISFQTACASRVISSTVEGVRHPIGVGYTGQLVGVVAKACHLPYQLGVVDTGPGPDLHPQDEGAEECLAAQPALRHCSSRWRSSAVVRCRGTTTAAFSHGKSFLHRGFRGPPRRGRVDIHALCLPRENRLGSPV